MTVSTVGGLVAAEIRNRIRVGDTFTSTDLSRYAYYFEQLAAHEIALDEIAASSAEDTAIRYAPIAAAREAEQARHRATTAEIEWRVSEALGGILERFGR